MSIRAVAVGAGAVATGLTACLMGAVIAASPAQAPTLDEACKPACPVVTPSPVRWQPNTSHEGWRLPVSPDRMGPRPTLRHN